MKKILSLALACVMLLCSVCLFASCGDSAETIPAGTSDAAETNPEVKTLTMATNAAFPPYEYYDGDKIVGIDAEVAQLIADELGMKLEIADIEFDSIVTGVQTGKYDMGMAGMTVTEERLLSVNFTDSYATGIQSVIVREDSPIQSVDDLYAEGATYVVGAQIATTGFIYACDDFGEDRVISYNAGADAVAALTSGKIDCVIIDNEPAKSFVAANTGLKLLDTQYAVEDYAIAVAKDNTDLYNKINAALKKLIENGKVQEIVDKYIPAN